MHSAAKGGKGDRIIVEMGYFFVLGLGIGDWLYREFMLTLFDGTARLRR